MKFPGRMLVEVMRSLFRKPATSLYPAERPFVPERFRGSIVFIAANCIGCRMCERDCPSRGAIVISKVAEKRFACRIDRDKCIACCQCVDSCPKKALEMAPDFEFASLRRESLRREFAATETKASPSPTNNDAAATPPQPARG